jgi:enoyl-CoA hydratase
MAYENIIFEKEDNIGIIYFNRPKALNALNPDLMMEFGDCLEKVQQDEDVRALILTGAGDKAFVAGADIKVMSTYGPLECRQFGFMGQKVIHMLEEMALPVIAAVNGFALGGGNEIAMACDFIYAADTAKFGQPEINLGIVPGYGGTQRLPRLVGKGHAKELCLTGEVISAERAAEIGLVNKIFPAASLMDEAKKTAKVMASKGRVALNAAKQVINRGFDVDLQNALAMEVDAFTVCFCSEDQKEGMNAFIEKRKPVFKGKL